MASPNFWNAILDAVTPAPPLKSGWPARPLFGTIMPRRFIAEFGTNCVIHIHVDVFGVTEDHMALIAKKISQSPSMLRAHWHHV